MTDPIDFAIAAASQPHGNIARQRLLGLGVTSSGVHRRVRSGRLFPVYNGVYGVGRPPRTPIERADAAVLAGGLGAALFAGSAMTLWAFWRRWEEPFEVVAPGCRRGPQGIILHRSKLLGPREVTRHFGIPVTRPARTLFDVAPRLGDDELARSVNRALHSNYLTRGHLAEQLLRHPIHRSARRIRPFVLTTDGPTRSDWERALPAFCDAYGLPRPLLSRHVAGYEADAVWLAERVVIELDSWEYHSERLDFESDRDRDVDRLVAGFPTVRITWERMHKRPAREAKRLHAILAARRRELAA